MPHDTAHTVHTAPEEMPRARPGAVLLCNLGTPDAPDAPAVRRYLAQFLRDPRVVELPRLLWWPILYGAILPFRPKKSAAKYASIWDAEHGSPLQWHTSEQARLLEAHLHAAGQSIMVRHAMRYGNPSIASALDALCAAGAERILVLPLYPQYSCTTTASVMDAVCAWARQRRHIPGLRFVSDYHDHALYIEALAHSVQEHWIQYGRRAPLLMSFHGVPERTRRLGDPYHDQARHSARLLAGRLGLADSQYRVTFQSRFGRARWLQPYTRDTLEAMARQGSEQVDVLCPGFASDCLETLEEIQHEMRQVFLRAGGKRLHAIACLNSRPDWIAALARMTLEQLAPVAAAPGRPPGQPQTDGLMHCAPRCAA